MTKEDIEYLTKLIQIQQTTIDAHHELLKEIVNKIKELEVKIEKETSHLFSN